MDTFHPGRLMSHAMTEPQIIDRTKLVTRRDGWRHLKPGEIYWAVRKGMGLKAGEKVHRLALLQCIGNRRERLYKMIEDKDYGRAECILEGFPHMQPADFVQMYVNAKRGRHPGDEISRIEFRYLILHNPNSIKPIRIPEKAGRCPVCGSALSVYPENFEYDINGTLFCNYVDFACKCGAFSHKLRSREVPNKIVDYLFSTYRFELE